MIGENFVMTKKLWGGRFTAGLDDFTDEWAASIGFDSRLYAEDIAGSIAHSRMLARAGILAGADQKAIENELLQIKEEIEAGKVEFGAGSEDIHMGIEGLLTERIGDAGKRLHTARSRNDQVATDIRLYLTKEITNTLELLNELRSALVELAETHVSTVMPGFTHLQHAQPVSLGFHLMAYYQMFTRDTARFEECRARTDVLPLGSGALAGTSYDTDREFLAAELGFSEITPNAMDAVSDRDFAIEYISDASITMMHLSRFCEELILWSSSEFSYIEMDDSYSTGSSIMPQKKNPDVAELIRGKIGRVYGDLTTLLTVMKGLPLAYNKDMQEDKEPLFDAIDTLTSCLIVFTGMIKTVKFKEDVLKEKAKTGFMNATDAADYLVGKGLPFRECHEIIGKLVLYCIGKNCAIEDLSLTELKKYSKKFGEDIYDKISPEACVNAKLSAGSTSEKSVLAQIAKAKEELQ
jgi:argininosuccinate lyase